MSLEQEDHSKSFRIFKIFKISKFFEIRRKENVSS